MIINIKSVQNNCALLIVLMKGGQFASDNYHQRHDIWRVKVVGKHQSFRPFFELNLILIAFIYGIQV